jgi:hypothetical protein
MGIISFLIFFSFIITLSIASVTILIVRTFYWKWPYCKFILHGIWIAFCFITIFTFLLGATFGAVGLIGQDGTPIIRWLFSSDNLKNTNPSFFEKGIALSYLDTCINRKYFYLNIIYIIIHS